MKDILEQNSLEQHTKVGAILNWLGDNAYEVYENIHWEEVAHKDNPDHVLKAFEKYFKPVQSSPMSMSTPPRSELRTRSGRLVKMLARYQC